MAIPDRFPGIYALRSDERDLLLERLGAAGVTCFELDGSSVLDTTAFHRAAVECLPLDPPLRGRERNWDAFQDSLFNGLAELQRTQVVIVWTDAHVMLNADLSGLIEVCIVVEDVIRDLQVASGESNIHTQLAVVLLGQGEGFGRVDRLFLD